MENELLKNDLDFTPVTVPTYNFIAIYGSIRGRMPDFRKALEQGYRIGNYRDLARARLEKYNPDENDRKNLNNNYFTLVGNPTLGDPMESGEEIIINDLEQKVFEPLRIQLLNMDSSTVLNSSWALPLAPSKEQAKEIYEQIKKDGLPHITILSQEQVKALKNDAYCMSSVRENILEGFFLGNRDEMNEYMQQVKNAKGVSSIAKIFGYYPGNFTDTRLVWAGSVGRGNAGAYSSHGLNYDSGRLFGVGAGVREPASGIGNDSDRGASASERKSSDKILSKDELEVLRAYRAKEHIIKTPGGVYKFSSGEQKVE